MRWIPNKSSVWFHVVVIYVFASFLWWAYLLTQKNEDLFSYRFEKERLEYNLENGLSIDSQDYLHTAHYGEVMDLYNRQRLMILGEGSVFILLLMLGAWSIQRYFNKERALATQQQNFQLSITHELKSPLAAIKLSSETLLRRLELEPPYRKLLTNSVHDVNRLENLVDNILLAAKVEGRAFNYSLEPVDLTGLLENLLDRYFGNLPEWTIEKQIKPRITVLADSMTLTSVIMNLLENSYKYAAEGKKLQVGLNKVDKHAKLTIADNGPGIPVADRLLVFDKFYRLGNEETRNAKGTGLGLFIVKRVVERHHGTVKVSENTPNGTIMTILLPLAD